LKLAETLLIVGTPQEALTHFVWLADRMPEVPPVRLGLARCQRRLGEPDKARQILDGLLVEFPNHGETLWERGELDLEQGKAGQA
jgi:predicted Zn-dependent protease